MPVLLADNEGFYPHRGSSWPEPAQASMGDLLPTEMSRYNWGTRFYLRLGGSEYTCRSFGADLFVRTYRTPESERRHHAWLEMVRSVGAAGSFGPMREPWVETPDGMRPSSVSVWVWAYGWPARCAFREDYVASYDFDDSVAPSSGERDQIYDEYMSMLRDRVPSRMGISMGHPGYRARTPWGTPEEVHLPTAPIWLGLIINIACYGTLWYAPGAIWRGCRRWRRSRSGRCLACGYNLGGLTTCPECGESV
ncbi:MAG: hypothetical protein DHS20C14_14050 [Phycisphaeraceae bacterium]|nr:MAG: hypothetical protein DHS20C14_14050 [Phycisphaeraceae bacterium]